MITEIFALLSTIFGALMSLGHFPQAYKIHKTKKAEDVSILTYITFTIGACVWLTYGILSSQTPIIITFVLSAISTTTVLILTIKYKYKNYK